MNPNTINWYEIPTTDLDRAARFYETLLGIKLKREVFFGTPHAIFVRGEGTGEGTKGVGGSLVANPKLKPGGGGVVYLDARGDLAGALERAPKAGGKVLMPSTSIGPMGTIALVEDTEGNTVGLHVHA
jgi:hypothetical protein